MMSWVLLAIVGALAGMVCAVSTLSTLYLIYCYRALVPYDRLVKKVLALEASQDELERQIEVQRKSFAGVRSSHKKKTAAAETSPVEWDLNSESGRDNVRRFIASGGGEGEE